MAIRRDGEKERHLNIGRLMQRFQRAGARVELIRIDTAFFARGESGDEDEGVGCVSGGDEDGKQKQGEEGAHGGQQSTKGKAGMSTALSDWRRSHWSRWQTRRG